jgi:phage terminase small subunit
MALLERGSFAIETVHNVNVKANPRVTIEATEAVIARIAELARRAGLDPAEQMKLIEANAEEVQDE